MDDARRITGTVALLSLEPWDTTWRRNQHLARRLSGCGAVEHVRFVNPPVKLSHVGPHSPVPGVRVLTPHLLMPRRRGGRALVAAEVRVWTRRADLLWINDPVLGVSCMRRGQPVLYDVTDDWRTANMSASERDALVRAEDELADRAVTVVCSHVLAERWRERYGVRAHVVQNGVDLDAHRQARGERLPGRAPHVVYVGTLHAERLDIPLLLALAKTLPEGQVDLVGPDSLDAQSRKALLQVRNIVLHGPVPYQEVPNVMAGADVLISPHRVDEFTMSLDAIKSFEYLATDLPVIATPSSGFQHIVAPGLVVAAGSAFVAAVVSAAAAGNRGWHGRADGAGWDARAMQFSHILAETLVRG